MSTSTVTATIPAPRMPTGDRVSLSADFLYEVGELLERHGHTPTSGASIPGAVGYALTELAAFVRAVRDVPAPDPEG